jgi:hypothetical protein
MNLLTLNLGLDIVDGIGRLHLEGDSLTRKGLDEDLHFEGLRAGKDCQFLIFDEIVSKTPENRDDGEEADGVEDGAVNLPRQDCRPQPSRK